MKNMQKRKIDKIHMKDKVAIVNDRNLDLLTHPLNS